MRGNNKILIFFVSALVVFTLGYLAKTSFSVHKYNNLFGAGEVSINGKAISVDIASNAKSRQQGLSGRQELATDEGMLFVFEEKIMPSFWMKDMNFPLDIIWIRDNAVVDISENLLPATGDNLPTYHPQEPVNYALEVNAGFARENDIKIGDGFEFRY